MLRVVRVLDQDSREGILPGRWVAPEAEVKGKVCRTIRRVLVVVRDKVEKVERDAHALVGREERLEVTADRHRKVGGLEAIEVVKSRSLTVGGDVIEVFKGNHSEQVTSDLYIKTSGQAVIEGGASFCFKMGGNFITVDTSGVTIKGTMIKINAGGSPPTGTAGTRELPKPPLAAEAGRDKASK